MKDTFGNDTACDWVGTFLDASIAFCCSGMRTQMPRLLGFIGLGSAIGCGGNAGPPSVAETSTARPKLVERIKFVETYVNFKRNYNDLEYDIVYQNNGSGLAPGPSDWDIRIIAIVPPDEIGHWIIAGRRDATFETPKWVATTARSIDCGSITEWYVDGNRTVGIDRNQNIVAYRTYTR